MTDRRILWWAMATVLGLVVVGCGSDDDSSTDSGDTPSDVAADPSDETDPPDETDETDAPESSGSGTATLTVDDGTVYGFEMSDCDTSENSTEFLVEPGYQLFGKSDDGFSMQFIRAAFEEEDASAIGSLEGDFDENGVNPKVSYNAIGDEEVLLTVDGGGVTGTAMMSSFDDSIHGTDIEVTIEVNC